ncbi:MAG: DUF2062 domain-containing protein [Burkholderiaceae bacterium]
MAADPEVKATTMGRRREGGWRRWLPDPKQVVTHPWLRWLGPRLGHPRLWHINRRGIAMALSIGLFFGLLIPVAQIPLAAIAAVLLRANIPVAVCSTLVTNPVTFAPIYIFAYQLGAVILGEPHHAVAPPIELPQSTELSSLTDLDIPDPGLFAWLAGWWDSLISAGKPLIVGLATLATVAGMSSYVLVSWSWRIRTNWVRRQRQKRFREMRAQMRDRRGPGDR